MIIEKVEVVERFLLQIEEGKIKDSLNWKLNEKAQTCEKLEGKIVLLKKELEKAKMEMIFNYKFRKGTEYLNEILEAQWDTSNWIGLGYEAHSISTSKLKGNKKITFILATK